MYSIISLQFLSSLLSLSYLFPPFFLAHLFLISSYFSRPFIFSFSSHINVFPFLQLNYKADGSPFWNQFFVAALRDSEGGVVNYVGVQCEVNTLPIEGIKDR